MSFCEPCLSKSVENGATFFCPKCDEFMCKTCAEHHSTFRLLRNHSLESLCDKLIGIDLTAYGSTGSDITNTGAQFAGPVWGKVDGTKHSINGDRMGKEEEIGQTKIVENEGAVKKQVDGDNGYVNEGIVAEMKRKGNECQPLFKESFQKDADCSSFEVVVERSNFAQVIGLNERPYNMIISPDGIRLIQGQITAVEAHLVVIRRFGVKVKNIFAVEMGRRFKHGEGILYFRTQHVKTIVSKLSKLTSRKQ